MSMDDMDRALELVREHGDEADFVGPRGEHLEAAAAPLGHPLPPTYRRFVEELGAGDIAGVELYGIVDADFESARGSPTRSGSRSPSAATATCPRGSCS
jgi:antitoxin YobK